jgi:hypothetical protein
MRTVSEADHRLDEHVLRALNEIKKAGTAGVLTDVSICGVLGVQWPPHMAVTTTMAKVSSVGIVESLWLPVLVCVGVVGLSHPNAVCRYAHACGRAGPR